MDEFTAAHAASAGGFAWLFYLGIAAFFRKRAQQTDAASPATGKRTRLVGTFVARDGSGRAHTLSCYQQYFDAGTRDDPSAERKGPLHILTSDGRRVDKLGTRKYRILGTRDLLTTDDPTAP